MFSGSSCDKYEYPSINEEVCVTRTSDFVTKAGFGAPGVAEYCREAPGSHFLTDYSMRKKAYLKESGGLFSGRRAVISKHVFICDTNYLSQFAKRAKIRYTHLYIDNESSCCCCCNEPCISCCSQQKNEGLSFWADRSRSSRRDEGVGINGVL